MAHEILSVKLCELDRRIGQLHSRISLSQTASPAQLADEIDRLHRECDAEDLTLRRRLEYSRALPAQQLAGLYTQAEDLIQSARSGWTGDLGPDERLLVAEYVLDFALQAADRALLISLEAIAAQDATASAEDSDATKEAST